MVSGSPQSLLGRRPSVRPLRPPRVRKAPSGGRRVRSPRYRRYRLSIGCLAEPVEAHVNRNPSMTGIWWTSVSIEIFLCSLTATTAHLVMSLGQTLFHRYLGHRGIGGRFFENHLYIHHKHYSGNHIVSKHYLNEEANNTRSF